MICSLFILLWEENSDEITSQVCRSLEEAEASKNDLMNSYKMSSDDIKIHEIKSSIKLSSLMSL